MTTSCHIHSNLCSKSSCNFSIYFTQPLEFTQSCQHKKATKMVCGTKR